MKVIIVGGGIAGLTMANALEKADIDYTLLERRTLFDPQVGASIGIGPGGMRILDQVGAAQEILDATKSIKSGRHRRADGSLIMPPDKNFPLLERRFGYGVCFLDRQIVLRALYNSVVEKGRCLLDKRVREIVHLENGVKVHCEDGTTYSGDIVLGCDGVNSKVRSEMWRIASQTEPDYFSQKEREKMTAEYICLFGISNPLEGLKEGDVDNMYDKGHSMLVITGKDGRIFWFYFERLSKPVHFHTDSFPRYTPKDAEDLAAKHGWRPWHDKYKLKDLWNNRITYTLVAMEEALFENWYWGRIATMGDNAHKMTANQGSGGNAAIESVAAMANQLKRLQEESSSHSAPVSSQEVRKAFSAWKAKRQARIDSTVKNAAKFCRMQGLESWGDFVTVFYVLPNASDYITALFTQAQIGAEVLEYLPLPERSFNGTALFNPKQGTGHQENPLVRTLLTLPLLAMTYIASQTPGDTSLITPFSTLLSASSAPRDSWLQAFYFQLTTAVLYAIWLIESHRRANALTLAQAGILFASASNVLGPALVAPVYYAFHYISSPIEKFAPRDMRLTNVAYTRTVLPMMLMHSLVPLALRLGGFSINMSGEQIWWNLLLGPFLVGIMQWALVKTGISTTNLYEDALFNQEKDEWALRGAGYILSGLSTLGWWYTLYTTGALPILDPQNTLFLLATGIWLTLLYIDLRAAGMLPRSLLTVAFVAGVGAIVLGPAASVGLGWLWRENCLVKERHRSAVTRERYAGRTVWEVDGSGPVRREVLGGNGMNGMNGHGK